MEKVELTKEVRYKFINRYFMDLQRWIPYRVLGLGGFKARIRNLITGKAEFVDTGFFLKWFGGCDVQEVNWDCGKHTKYLIVDRQKGAKSKFEVSVYEEGVIDTNCTFCTLRHAWAYEEEVKKQFPGADIWFVHTREVSIKLT